MSFDPPTGRPTREQAGRYARDWIERVLATAAQAGIAYALVETADWPQWVYIPITVAGAAAKAWIAKTVGNKDSASLAPGV